MNKQQLIEAIRQYNRSAKDAFLLSFNHQVLETYLRRLQTAHDQRGPASVWVRQTASPALITQPS